MKNTLILATSLVSFSIFGQNSAQDKKLIIHVETGFTSNNLMSFKEVFWLENVPNFVKPNDTMGFQASSYKVLSLSPSFKFSAEKEISKPFLKSKNITSTIGFSMGLGSRNTANQGYSKHTKTVVDTLTSSQTGAQTMVYEQRHENIWLNYNSKSAFFAFRSMNRTDISKRVSFGLGFELGYGFSFADGISRINSGYTYSDNYSSYISNNEPETINTWISSAPFAQSILFNFPIECGIRLQKKEGKLFTNSAITVNFNPSLNWSFIEKNQYFNGNYSAGIGFRQTF